MDKSTSLSTAATKVAIWSLVAATVVFVLMLFLAGARLHF